MQGVNQNDDNQVVDGPLLRKVSEAGMDVIFGHVQFDHGTQDFDHLNETQTLFPKYVSLMKLVMAQI